MIYFFNSWGNNYLIILAGFPAATTPFAKDFVTIEPAPITVFSPISTPGKIMVFAPIHAPRLIITLLDCV